MSGQEVAKKQMILKYLWKGKFTSWECMCIASGTDKE